MSRSASGTALAVDEREEKTDTGVALRPAAALLYPDLATASTKAGERIETASLQEQIRQRAYEEGRAAAQAELAQKAQQQVIQEREAILAEIKKFYEERAQYFDRVEREILNLALSIARKVLHRELQTDPLALLGLVRIALQRVEGATATTLRVAPSKSEPWKAQIAASDLQGKLEVVEDAALTGAACRLETSLGSVDLSVDAQLKEIETGLMDLLAVRKQEP